MIGNAERVEQFIDCGNRLCIVGAGPHGLIAARAMKRNYIDFEILERHCDVGGLWDASNAGTPLYQSCHFISSANSSAYPDYPMPDHFPDYPSHHHILDYIRRFAKDFGLYPNIRFNAEVVCAEPVGDGRWDVTLNNGEVRRYAALVCCPGSNWHPRMPELEGEFDGEIIHSVQYNDASQFAGKRVLIIGLGNSGADIACDAAPNAAATFVSVRRGYHFVPKHIFGVPLLDFLHGAGHELVPPAMQGLDLPEMVRVITGDPTRFGFPVPDHQLLESHPLVNTQLLHYLAHGDAHVKGAISQLSGKHVHFADGSIEEIDLIVCATGYDHKIPFIDEDLLDWVDGRPQLYLTVFHDKHPTLFVFGLLEAGGAPYQQMDDLANFIANYLKDRTDSPARAAKWEALVRSGPIDLKAGMNYVQSARTANYVNIAALIGAIEHLKTETGWETAPPGGYDALRISIAG